VDGHPAVERDEATAVPFGYADEVGIHHLTRGEIWLANLSPRRGTEPRKTRPVLIVQAQALLDAGHPSTLIVPLTSNLTEDGEPLRIRVEPHGKLRRRSDLLVDQVRAIDNARLIEGPVTTLDRAALERVDDALKEVLDLAGTSAEAGGVGTEADSPVRSE
jgi:mRNA interferase MazF